MERETEESYNNGDEDIEELSAAVTEIEGTPRAIVSKAKPPTREHKKMDEVDLKILQTLQEKEPEKKTTNCSSLRVCCLMWTTLMTISGFNAKWKCFKSFRKLKMHNK